MKFKKFSILMGVGLMTYLSTLGQTNLLQTQAALTAPTTYNVNYQYNSSTSRFTLGTTSVGTTLPTFTRTTDSTYYNYTTTFNRTDFTQVPDGMEITMTFNRSNTSWASVANLGVVWYSNDTKIGSNNTVGSIANKVYLQFDNQTNKDYKLFFDQSSKGSEGYFTYEIDDERYYGDSVGSGTILMSHIVLNRWYLPAYSKVEIYVNASSSSYYFDAWYLQDLGVSASYNQGLDDGEVIGYEDGLGNNPNILLSGFQAMVGILINMALMVLNLTVFDVSLLSIFSIMALFVGVIWILKLVRG
jgi:hypothetical protein